MSYFVFLSYSCFLVVVRLCLLLFFFFCFLFFFLLLFFFLMIRRPPRSTLFPYTTPSDLATGQLAALPKNGEDQPKTGARYALWNPGQQHFLHKLGQYMYHTQFRLFEDIEKIMLGIKHRISLRLSICKLVFTF